MTVKMIEGSDQARVQKCIEAVNEVLKAFDCTIIPTITLGPQGVMNANAAIAPIPKQPKVPEEIQAQMGKMNAKKRQKDLEAMKKMEAEIEQKEGFSVKDSRRKI